MSLAAFDQFLEHISQLRIREWSVTSPLPQFLRTDLTPGEKLDFAVDLALLPRLYGGGYDNLVYALLEAYLWSNAGKRALANIGWLEGNIVIVDFSKAERRVLLPQVDSPAVTLCTPFLWGSEPGGDPLKLLGGRFEGDSDSLKTRIALSKHLGPAGTLLPQELRATGVSLPDLLCNLFIDPGDRRFLESGEVRASLITPIREESQRFLGHLGVTEQPTEAEWERSLTQTLKDRLLHILVAEEIAHQRTLRLDESKGDEFVEYFHNLGLKKSRLEEDRAILFLDDAQISLACLDYCLGEGMPHIAGHEVRANWNSNALYHALGLAAEGRITERGRNLIRWLKSVVKSEQPGDPQDREAFEENWRATALTNRDIQDEVRKSIDAADRGGLNDLCLLGRTLFKSDLCDTRSRDKIEKQHRLRLGIHLFLRYAEPFPRHLLVFPLTHTGELTENHGKVAAYFLGSIADPPTSEVSRDQQIVHLKRFVEQAFTNASLHQYMSQTISKGREEVEAKRNLYAASFVFGHETKNRADAIQANVHKQAIRQMLASKEFSPESKDSLRQMAEAFSLAEDLYGISELVSQLTKLSSGNLPEKWVRDEYKEKTRNWHREFLGSAVEYLNTWANSCRDLIRSTISPYAAMAQRRNRDLVLRAVVGENCVVRPPILVTDEPPNLDLPPFQRFDDNRAPAIALLAGVSEHLRNAARYLIDRNNAARIIRLVGMLHIDFDVHVATDERAVVVRLWNPCADENPPPSETIRIMAELYKIIGTNQALLGVEANSPTMPSGVMTQDPGRDGTGRQPCSPGSAIEIRPTVRAKYAVAGEVAEDYVVSEVILRPGLLRFV